MKRDLSGRLALDTSALIEVIFSTPAAFKLKEILKGGLVEAHTTKFNIAEMRCILCRRVGLAESNERVGKLLASGYISVSP